MPPKPAAKTKQELEEQKRKEEEEAARLAAEEAARKAEELANVRFLMFVVLCLTCV